MIAFGLVSLPDNVFISEAEDTGLSLLCKVAGAKSAVSDFTPNDFKADAPTEE